MKVRDLLCGLLAGCMPLTAAQAQEKKNVPAGTPVTIIVKPAEPASPPITMKLNGRQAKATPTKCACGKTGGGNIDVAQPAPDTVIITVTGAALAEGLPVCGSSASIHVDFSQCFEVVFEKNDLKYPKVTLEGRVIGALRSHCKGGCAQESAHAVLVPACGGPGLNVTLPANSVCNGENLSVNDHEGPCGAPLLPGKYTLNAQFEVSATHPIGLCKPSSDEFAPDPALDPLWIGPKDPYHGIAKKDFGFQITIKVLEDTPPGGGGDNGNGKENGEKAPAPKP